MKDFRRIQSWRWSFNDSSAARNLINNPVPCLEVAGNLDTAERKGIFEQEKLLTGCSNIHGEDAETTEHPIWRVWLVDWIPGA